MERHKLLQKQIRKFIDGDNVNLDGLDDFFTAVNNSYASFDRDKKITEHAFQVSEREYQEVMDNLKKENELKKASIQKVKHTLIELDSKNASFLDESEDLIEIIDFLQEQVQIKNELETTLIAAKENAEKAALAKSNFLSVMSHEIRTPLNAIIGNIHILKQEPHLPSQEDFIDILQVSAFNLLSLINDVLDFSKIEEGKVNFIKKPLELRSIAEIVKATNKFKAAEKENEIIVSVSDDIPKVLLGDDVRLNQILNNLMSNALKFTNKGMVYLDLSLDRQEGSEIFVNFSVKDSGIGIQEDSIEKIFERFTQADSNTTREFGGSGLGLTIIRKLLNLQDSEIHVESEYGKGARFYFTLAFSTLTKEDGTTIVSGDLDAKCPLEGKTVLLVEDVKFNVLVAQRMIEAWGMKVDLAENGQIAVGKVGETTYDVILMDLQMPVMDGFTATKNIRKMGITTSIVALTASVSVDSQTEVINCGMNDYLTKPFNPKDLKRALQKAIYSE
ncbi:response regulator [Arcticibacterium luteifluviistationis]|uniref:histidine kinase n=1 Tax=Arcticibacterium luteifluviistationis TaxID=1784714 RepID=A0A2Z4GD70_9BACT|nr:response regulator [Arcticibacterium luteifluviistationis]AWV99094.1 hybrid sensor histidine kinase/response regulator [Arcticibacterium luteifluviistationis]